MFSGQGRPSPFTSPCSSGAMRRGGLRAPWGGHDRDLGAALCPCLLQGPAGVVATAGGGTSVGLGLRPDSGAASLPPGPAVTGTASCGNRGAGRSRWKEQTIWKPRPVDAGEEEQQAVTDQRQEQKSSAVSFHIFCRDTCLIHVAPEVHWILVGNLKVIDGQIW